jgi:MFS family permease
MGGALRLLGDGRFRALVVVGALLSLVTVSDGFLYLTMQRRLGFTAGYLPLLYVVTALVYLTLAVPVGRLADRIGRARVFVAGYVLLLAVYAALLVPGATSAAWWLVLPLCLVLFGAYYAATDGVLMALASAMLPAEVRGSGLGLVTTATNLARLFASVLFGALWTWQGSEVALVAFAGALAVAAVLAAATFSRTERQPA